MFDFGIEGYRPDWGNGLDDAMRHAARMRALVGRRLTDAWLVWDLERDEWWADCPVLLDFDGERIEINHARRRPPVRVQRARRERPGDRPPDPRLPPHPADHLKPGSTVTAWRSWEPGRTAGPG
ncbi:hypothetical protein ACQPYE_03270 [Actinosynnema sp. CA-299493]